MTRDKSKTTKNVCGGIMVKSKHGSLVLRPVIFFIVYNIYFELTS